MLRVLAVGLRGFPDVEGGVERHAEHLYPELARLGCDVEVVVRSPYHPRDKARVHRNVRLTPIWSPKGGPLEALLHTLLAVCYAGVVRPDVLHIHAVGPALVTPLARLLGLRVVVTHHGADYDREKWNAFARAMLRLGERLGMRFAHGRIAISNATRDLIACHCARDADVIPNGVELPELPNDCTRVRRFGLEPGRYVLQVSRFVAEKRQLDLIRAFRAASPPGWKLALVGSLERRDAYTREVARVAESGADVVLTDFQRGEALGELFAHAGLFVLPSSHEGLPIAALEAMSYGLPVVASDIPANAELALPPRHYFPVGDVDALAERLRDFTRDVPAAERAERVQRLRAWVTRHHDWRVIARQTLTVYRRTRGATALLGRTGT